MVTFRSVNNNNNRRPQFRNNNNNRRPPFRGSNEGSKFSNNDNFRRNAPGRNNHNASKLIEKYNDLAREALANEDKILSENYFQHADHFTRIQNEQEKTRMAKVNSSATTIIKQSDDETKNEKPSIEVDEKDKKNILDSSAKEVIKSSEKKIVEKKSSAI
ncbi:DUF4167 domain-containing protein [Candidatus Pelagibacter sp.]|nr:DUF4167 domain-containing protein [Candidatus Pelagibacter sp.]